MKKWFDDCNGFRTEHLLILPNLKEKNTFNVFKIPKEARMLKIKDLVNYIKVHGNLPENGKIRLYEKYYKIENVKKHAEEVKILSDVLKEYGIEYYAEFF